VSPASASPGGAWTLRFAGLAGSSPRCPS
jgi:hypothetical protein